MLIDILPVDQVARIIHIGSTAVAGIWAKPIIDIYEKLKLELWKQYEHDRDGYTEAKTEFVREFTSRAKEEFPARYEK